MDAARCGFDGFGFQKRVPNKRPKNRLIFDFNLSERDLNVSLAVVCSDNGCSLRGNDSSLDSSCRSIGDARNWESASEGGV
jgi:hypothetical protein